MSCGVSHNVIILQQWKQTHATCMNLTSIRLTCRHRHRIKHMVWFLFYKAPNWYPKPRILGVRAVFTLGGSVGEEGCLDVGNVPGLDLGGNCVGMFALWKVISMDIHACTLNLNEITPTKLKQKELEGEGKIPSQSLSHTLKSSAFTSW